MTKLSPKMIEIAKERLLILGTLSTTYLQRILKCSHSTAKEIMDRVTSDNTYSVAFKKDE